MTDQPEDDLPTHDPNAYAPPTAAPEVREAPRGTTKAQRLAGAFLIMGSCLILAERIIDLHNLSAIQTSPFSLSNPMTIALAFPLIWAGLLVLMDLVLGGMLIARKHRFVAWTVIRLVLGMILVSVTYVVFSRYGRIDSPAWMLILIPNVTLLVMLLGDGAQKFRVTFGAFVIGLYGILSICNLGVVATGINPLGWVIETANGTIESNSIDEVTGREVAYKLELPPNKWHLARNNALGDGTDADRWLIRPDVKAQIIVTLDGSPDMGTIPDDYTTSNVKHFQESKHVLVRKREPLRKHPNKGHLVLFDNERSRDPDGWIVGIVTTYRRGYFIQAFAPKKVFPEIEAELRAIIESLELPPPLPVKAPEDCEPNAVTQIEGLARKYVLLAPGGPWFQRKATAVKKDDPSTDQWLVRPDKDAHIWVIVQSVSEGEIDLDKYTEEVAKTISSASNMTLLSRDRPPSRTSEGRLLTAKGHNNGIEYRYMYGIYVDGPNAYQIIATTRSTYFDEMEADFLRVIEQFELPKKR